MGRQELNLQEGDGTPDGRWLRRWLAHEVRARSEWGAVPELLIGVLGGLLAVLVRLSLPLAPQQLPTLPVVVTLAVITTFVGVRAGVATAVVGGVLSWYFFFNPYSWSLANQAWIPLLGFTVIATVIITTAQMYRSTARASYERDLRRLQAEADTAQLFAREMAHRLKNALTIVQSIAFQTIGTSSEEAAKFAGRLKALAEANELLNEHIDRPSATVTEVIQAALMPFGLRRRFDVTSVQASIPSQQVVALALALHELTTNAVKYGALSVSTGRVTINVVDAGQHVHLTWKEHGGPVVQQPTGAGFGTRLLQRSGVNTELAFETDGLRCSMGLRRQ